MFDHLIKGSVATIKNNLAPLEHSTPAVMLDMGVCLCYTCGNLISVDDTLCNECGERVFIVPMDINNDRKIITKIIPFKKEPVVIIEPIAKSEVSPSEHEWDFISSGRFECLKCRAQTPEPGSFSIICKSLY